MMSVVIPFTPLEKKYFGVGVAEALLTNEVYPLGELPVFDGAGIYAIYYKGNFHAYQQISRLNSDGRFVFPIYVGKAMSDGARMGVDLDLAAGKVLHGRLMEHVESVNAAENLDLRDFYCQFLVADDMWISLGEALIIARFTPIWNSLIDGFVNHHPRDGRRAGMLSRWDVLHPGRCGEGDLPERSESVAQIAQDAETYLKVLPSCLWG